MWYMYVFNVKVLLSTVLNIHSIVCLILAVVPVANENRVQLLWQLPCLFDKYR